LDPQVRSDGNAGSAEWFTRALHDAMRVDAGERGTPFETYEPDADAVAEIHKIRANKYLNPAETFRMSPGYAYSAARRFPQGKIEFYVENKNGYVSSCAIKGDFIGAAPVETLEHILCGLRFGAADFSAALDDAIVGECLGGLSKKDFLDFIFS
jgi:lipoate-protein ligase A